MKTRSQRSAVRGQRSDQRLSSVLSPWPRLRWAGCCLALALRSARAKEGPLSRLRPSGFGGQAVVLPPSSGSALIVVLWVIGLLSMFVMAFAFDMHVEARITSS